MNRLFLLLLVTSAVACTTREVETTITGTVRASAMVVSAHPLATEVGVATLRKGGNAIDAAVATQFALAVVYPSAGNIGGGGFMVVRMNNGTTSTLDYREMAPSTATQTMYLGKDSSVIAGLSERGHLSCGVPGTVAGLFEAHRKYGKLAWKELVQPAVDLALQGFTLTEKEAAGLNTIQEDLKEYNSVMPDFLIREKWMPHDTLRLTDLGKTLERIRDSGAAGFYEGKTADYLIAEMQRGHGLLTQNDLRNYRAVWRTPIIDRYKDYTILSMGPPSSGGIALIQLLKSIEPYPVSDWGHNSIQYIHLLTEAERRVYADRAAYLADPDFVNIPISSLVDKLYLEERMKTFDPTKATSSATISAGKIMVPESPHTTHLSVVDAQGNAVAATTTLNDNYGSRVVVAEAGFFLNDEMDDFSIKAGVPNMYGATGSEANKIEPAKRMLSSMTPTIVERDGKLFMVVGSPGGTTIITTVLQTILNVIEFDMTMQEAVNAKRIHSQWLPDEIQPEENALDHEMIEGLTAMGHVIGPSRELGRVDAILVHTDGTLEAGADPRGDDTGDGY